MDAGDIVSIDYLLEKGYRPLWDKDVGTKDEIRVFHHPELYHDIRIVREPSMPEIYKVNLVLPLKVLRAEMKLRDYK